MTDRVRKKLRSIVVGKTGLALLEALVKEPRAAGAFQYRGPREQQAFSKLMRHGFVNFDGEFYTVSALGRDLLLQNT